MKSFKTQSEKDRKAKISHLGGGGMPKPNSPTSKPDLPGFHAKGGKATSHKPKKAKTTAPGPSAEALLARPVPASQAMAGAGMGDARPAPVAPAGLAAMQQPLKKGGRAHRADGGRAHHMTAGAGSGEGRLEKIK
jgi:hypothetical protein